MAARDRKHLVLACVLILAVAAVYAQVVNHGFINYDDPDYVTDNPHVRAGLTPQSAAWAFTTSFAANWFPITWLSHMLDYQLFGLQGRWHHLDNVLIHALGTLLLFALLRRMTGSLWPSAAVAFLFAVHPLHVESVAWIAERKDVLSGFFFFLTLWCYVRYVERPKLGRYCLVALGFCLGLMSKPMLVTLPFVLLLLDVWPLERFSLKTVREKAPLFLISICASVITYLVQQRGGAVTSGAIPFTVRIENALASMCAYLGQMFWPANLAVFYPYPAAFPAWKVAACAVVLLGLSVLAVRSLRRHPYFFAGWFWYVGTLIPVIGLVQVGEQSRADRYTYLPLIGVFIILSWGAAEAFKRWPRAKPTMAALSAAGCIACAWVAWMQVGYWKSDETLYRHTIDSTSGNYVAHTNLGIALQEQGRMDEAVSNYEAALRIRPHFVDAENALGVARVAQNRAAEAVAHFLAALRVKPDFSNAQANLGDALDKLGRRPEAEEQYRAAIRSQADNAVAHSGLGMVLSEEGRAEEALREVREAVRLRPDYGGGHFDLGMVLAGLGRTEEALAEFAEAVRLQPSDASAHYNLGTALGVLGRFDEAIDQFNAALRLRPGYVSASINLGKAFASLGQLDKAIEQFSEALRMDPNSTEARDNLEDAIALQSESGQTVRR